LGEFTILSVRHQLNYLNEKKLEEKYQVLNDTIQALTHKLEDLQNELATLVEKESFSKLNQT
jgi:cell division protein FtsB